MPKIIDRPAEIETGEESPVSSVPPEFLKFMADMSERMDTLAQKVEAVSTGRQQFRPMNPLMQPGAVEKLQVPRGVPLMQPELGERIPTLNGARLSPQLAAAFPQRFELGDRVTINPAAERGQVRIEVVMKTIERKDHNGQPFTDVKEVKNLIPITWGELIATLPQLYCPSPPRNKRACPGVVSPGGACDTCGWAPTVASVEFMDSRGQWVYKVNMPGIHTDGRAKAFFDYELDSA